MNAPTGEATATGAHVPSRLYRRRAALLLFLLCCDLFYAGLLTWQRWHVLDSFRYGVAYHSPLGVPGDWLVEFILSGARQRLYVNLLLLHLCACALWVIWLTWREWRALRSVA